MWRDETFFDVSYTSGQPSSSPSPGVSDCLPEAGPADLPCGDPLTIAYWSYWGLSDSDPPEAFQAAYREIVSREAQTDPLVAWRTLCEAATAFHASSGICPFCRERGALHLPAEQLMMELCRGSE